MRDIRQRRRVVEGIVQAVDQNVFNRRHASCLVTIVGDGIPYIFNPRTEFRRDDARTQLVVRRMERHGQIPRPLQIRQLADAARHAACRNRHMAGPQPDAVRRTNHLQRGDEIIQIVHRLAHAHHDHVAYELACFTTRKYHLVNDFRYVQIPHEALPPRLAEHAMDLAADLRADAYRVPFRRADQHRLDRMAVLQAGQPFDRPVVVRLACLDLQCARREIRRKLFPQGFREVRHFVEGHGQLLENPVVYLCRAEGGLPMGLQPFRQLLFRLFFDGIHCLQSQIVMVVI